MLTIETVATVTEEGTITAKVPGHLPQGEHRVVIVMDEAPLRSSGRFPDMSAFREGLGAPRHPGNTVVEMREGDRPGRAGIRQPGVSTPGGVGCRGGRSSR
jgi:hypothetical protein